MKLLLDMDGVLADFDGALFEDLADVVDWPPEAYRREARYCTDYLPSKLRKLVRRHIEDTHFFRHLPVIEGAQEGVDALLDRGHDVWVCTKPLEANPYCANDKMHWISQHFPDLVGKVIIAPRKSMIHGDLLLDDAHKYEDLKECSYLPVWYEYAHNFNEGTRYFTWEDPVTLLEDYVRLKETLT